MSTKLFPGMLDNSLEIFTYQSELKIIKNGSVKNFTDLSFDHIQLLENEINNDKQVELALHDMQPNCNKKRIEQFAICRFGGLDHQGDIVNGKLQDGEYWECPNRATCPHNGIVCKLPVVNEVRLTTVEVEILKMTCTETKNIVIAETLNLPLGTFHKIKKHIWKSFKVYTKQEASLISRSYNIR